MTATVSPRVRLGIAAFVICAVVTSATGPALAEGKPAWADHKQQVVQLLESLTTGDSHPLGYINPDKYIQHNLAVADGLAGVKALRQSLPTGSTKVHIARVFHDGDFAFTHVDYEFFGPKVGFDIFRFEDGKIVEHWDNLQEAAAGPNPSGHTMLDGPTQASDLDKTNANKALMRAYMDDLLHGRKERFASYFDGSNYIQHNPWVADDLTGLSGRIDRKKLDVEVT